MIFLLLCERVLILQKHEECKIKHFKTYLDILYEQNEHSKIYYTVIWAVLLFLGVFFFFFYYNF